jgi:hypothetical protein
MIGVRVTCAFSRACAVGSWLLLTGCAITRPVIANPTPSSIQEYVQHRAPATLLVSDSSGHKRWVYNAVVAGDTLRGRRTTTNPPVAINIPLNQINGVAESRYSSGRTLALVGGIAALVLVLALNAPPPTY